MVVGQQARQAVAKGEEVKILIGRMQLGGKPTQEEELHQIKRLQFHGGGQSVTELIGGRLYIPVLHSERVEIKREEDGEGTVTIFEN